MFGRQLLNYIIMPDNNRIYYACQAVNIWSNDRLSSFNGFVSGVQSLGVDSDFNIINIPDYGRSKPHSRIYTKPSINLTMERLIPKQGQLFIKNDTDILSGVFNEPRPEHNILLIYGSDEEPLVDSDKVNDLILFQNMLLTSVSYSISTTLPSISESLSFSGKIQSRSTNEIELLVAPEYAGRTDTYPQNGMVRRQDYRNHKMQLNPSIVPETVKQLIDFSEASLTDKKFFGLTSIDMSFSIAYQEILDTGKWRGSIYADVNKYTYPLLPLEVSCSFKINAKRSIRKELILSDTNFLDEEIKVITGPFCFNLGTKNRITSINCNGGSTGGEIVEYEISYSNINRFKVELLN